MRKALCVGIDCYDKVDSLYGCVNDANSVKVALERNGDGTLNFDVKLRCSTSKDSFITRNELKDLIEELFKGDSELALLYYSGHGAFNINGGYLCTSEINRPDEGLSLNDVMGFVANSNARNKIVILDSCFSGSVGDIVQMGNYAMLQKGTTILAACEKDQYSYENNGHGVFTSLLVEALYGGAMNILGEVTPGAIYAYIDSALGAWEQRPVFKANINRFVSLRKNTPQIEIDKLRKITEIFDKPEIELKLDPTFEHDKHEVENKEINEEHEEIFKILQQYVKLSLVVPVDEEHMYYAAIHSKSCKLTAKGQHYWSLVKKNLI